MITFGGRGVTLLEAIERLQKIPGNPYRQLLESTTPLLRLPEVEDLLNVNRIGVIRLIEEGMIQGAVDHGGKTGWRIPRDSVILYLASITRGVW